MAWMATAAPWISAGLSAFGGLLQGNDATRQLGRGAQIAAPGSTNVMSPFGNIGITPEQINMSLSGGDQAIQALLGGQIMSGLGGQGIYSPFANQFMAQGGNALGGLFDASQSALGSLPQGQFDATQAMLGQAGGNLMGLGGSALGAGLGALNPNQAFNPATGFLNQSQQGFAGAGNVQGLVDDRLAALRAASAPQEEQAYNSLQQRLFSQGRLGSTGGSRDIESFARGLGQADLGRQVEAQNLGLNTSQLLAAQAAQQGQLGANLMGQGFGAGSQLANLGGGLFSQGVGFGQQGLTNALGFSDMGANRAQQRMQNAMSLFGFGSDLENLGFNRGTQSITARNESLQPLMQLLSGGLSNLDIANAARGRQADYASRQVGSGGLLGGLLGSFGGALGGLFD